jgi:hypothetical protein
MIFKQGHRGNTRLSIDVLTTKVNLSKPVVFQSRAQIPGSWAIQNF